MNCRQISSLSTAYVDGELDDRRASALRGHLRTCQPCRHLVADEARLVDAADELAPVDPPAALWSAIEGRLADAEIADAGRSRAWFWWQTVRERSLPIAAGVACAALLVVWLTRGSRSGEPPSPATASAPPTDVEVAAREPAAAPAPLDFDAARRAEVERADRRYRKVLSDLRELAEDAGDDWPTGAGADVAQRLEELGRAAQVEERRVSADGSLDPAARGDLYRIYRAEIAVLREATVSAVLR